jgi:hypothetical protein
MPLEHLVYVGDNNGDYLACRNFGVDFVEARLFKDEVEKATGTDSLVFDAEGRKNYFTNWSEFEEVLDNVGKGKLKRQIQQKGERLINA